MTATRREMLTKQLPCVVLGLGKFQRENGVGRVCTTLCTPIEVDTRMPSTTGSQHFSREAVLDVIVHVFQNLSNIYHISSFISLAQSLCFETMLILELLESLNVLLLCLLFRQTGLDNLLPCSVFVFALLNRVSSRLTYHI